jgi:CIC family chloride channel protein
VPLVFYYTRDVFRAIPIMPHLKPAIGGLAVGLLALAVPQVLGGGYGWIQEAIDGQLAVTLMLALVFAKLLAFALTVSSGGSGGVFAPTLFVGAMLGGCVAAVLAQPAAPFVIVGMAALFAGSARVPIATMLMVTEMTGGYELLVPAALAVTLAYMVEASLSRRFKYGSLYEAQVPSPAYSPAHHAEHLHAAFRLLREHRAAPLKQVEHLDLRTLLESGVPVELHDGKQLSIATLAPHSDLVGRLATTDVLDEGATDVDLTAVLREGYTILPETGARLRAGDTLLVLAAPEARERVARHFGAEQEGKATNARPDGRT